MSTRSEPASCRLPTNTRLPQHTLRFLGQLGFNEAFELGNILFVAAVQNCAAALIAGLQATVSRSLCLASPKRTGINASGGQQAKHALTFQPDHPMGAGQPKSSNSSANSPPPQQILRDRFSGNHVLAKRSRQAQIARPINMLPVVRTLS